jgi:hypothetical protein
MLSATNCLHFPNRSFANPDIKFEVCFFFFCLLYFGPSRMITGNGSKIGEQLGEKVDSMMQEGVYD